MNYLWEVQFDWTVSSKKHWWTCHYKKKQLSWDVNKHSKAWLGRHNPGTTFICHRSHETFLRNRNGPRFIYRKQMFRNNDFERSLRYWIGLLIDFLLCSPVNIRVYGENILGSNKGIFRRWTVRISEILTKQLTLTSSTKRNISCFVKKELF